MAIAFKGNTIAIFMLCAVTIVVFVFWGFDRIETPEDSPAISASSTFTNPNFRKKDYIGALTEAARQIKVDTNLIHQRLEMDYEPWQEFYMMIWNMPEHAWEIIRYKLAVKILKGFLEEKTPTFTMVFSGTSVTAGHESFYSRSYVGIIEERFKKTLRAAGIDLVLRNAAQPAFSCHSNNYCFPATSILPNEEIDFLSWENTFSCGSENAPALEYFSRLAAQHKAIAFYTGSGGTAPANCEASPDPVPYISYDWTPEVAGITHVYSPSMAKVNEYKSRMLARFRLGSAADKLVRLSQRPYKGTAPHGMSLYTRTRQACNTTNVLNPKYMKHLKSTISMNSNNDNARRQLAAKDDIEPSSITMNLKPKKSQPSAAAAGGKSATAASTSKTTAAATAAAASPKANAESDGNEERSEKLAAKLAKKAEQQSTPPARAAYCLTSDLWATMCHHQGGPKILTKEFSYKGNAPGVVQGKSSYNPSVGMHILRAELFLYNYNHIFLDAIFNLQKDLSLISAQHQNDPQGMFRHQLQVYERKLLGLQRTLTTPLAEPKHCPAWECGNPVENTQCFTDYEPNYLDSIPNAPDNSLSSLVIGNVSKAGWEHVERSSASYKQFGNKDRQVFYASTDFSARLPLLLSLTRGKDSLARNIKEADYQGETEGIVKVFHAMDRFPLEYAEFYLELNVAATEEQATAILQRYNNDKNSNSFFSSSPPNNEKMYVSNKTPVKLIKDVHYVVQKTHVHFFGLPKGYHVLIVQVPSESDLTAIVQRLNAGYAKQFKEQQEDADTSTPAPQTTRPAKKAPAKRVADTENDNNRRMLAEDEDVVENKASKKKAAPAATAAAATAASKAKKTDNAVGSKASVSKLVKPKHDVSKTIADATKEEAAETKVAKPKGPKVVDVKSFVRMTVGQVVVF